MEIERIVLSKKASPIAYTRKDNGELDEGRIFDFDENGKNIFDQASEQLIAAEPSVRPSN